MRGEVEKKWIYWSYAIANWREDKKDTHFWQKTRQKQWNGQWRRWTDPDKGVAWEGQGGRGGVLVLFSSISSSSSFFLHFSSLGTKWNENTDNPRSNGDRMTSWRQLCNSTWIQICDSVAKTLCKGGGACSASTQGRRSQKTSRLGEVEEEEEE